MDEIYIQPWIGIVMSFHISNPMWLVITFLSLSLQANIGHHFLSSADKVTKAFPALGNVLWQNLIEMILDVNVDMQSGSKG